MVRGTGGGANGLDIILQKLHKLGFVEQGLGLLIQEGLVGRAAALGHKHKVVLAALGGEQIYLGRQI